MGPGKSRSSQPSEQEARVLPDAVLKGDLKPTSTSTDGAILGNIRACFSGLAKYAKTPHSASISYSFLRGSRLRGLLEDPSSPNFFGTYYLALNIKVQHPHRVGI